MPPDPLDRYALPRPVERHFLGNAGGFSGSRVWKVETPAGAFCLKAWPPGRMSADHLVRIHGWMTAARDAGLAFVPAVVSTSDGATAVEADGRLWDVTEWMPGRADFREHPTAARIAAACSALAQLHRAWADRDCKTDVPASIERRLRTAAEWSALVRSGWRPDFDRPDLRPVAAVAQEAWQRLPALVARVGPDLAAWHGPRHLHPCLCDIWHDHVLFDGDRVAGVIDYGAMRLDHPAADLARLLGSLAGESDELWAAGLEAYRRLCPLTDTEIGLVRALDRTGTVLAAANWLRWLYHAGRRYDDLTAVAARLQAVVARLR